MKFKEKWVVKINFDAEIGIKVHIREKELKMANSMKKIARIFTEKLLQFTDNEL